MTSAFSWQNSISLCPASFHIPRPNLPVMCYIFYDGIKHIHSGEIKLHKGWEPFLLVSFLHIQYLVLWGTPDFQNKYVLKREIDSVSVLQIYIPNNKTVW